jgi:hypothetical protein
MRLIQATWTLVELQRFARQVRDERAWFESVGLEFMNAQVDYRQDGRVEVEFMGLVGSESVIEAHFGNPTWLIADRLGPMPWTGPTGRLVIKLVDDRGRPLPGIAIAWSSEHPEASGGQGDLGFGTDDRGRLVLDNMPAVSYRFRFMAEFDDGNSRVLLLETSLRNKPGGSTHTIVIQRDQLPDP